MNFCEIGGVPPHMLRHRVEVSGQLHDPTVVPSGERESYPVPIGQEIGVGPRVRLDAVDKREGPC
jgi:hypothetical protein